MAENAWTKVLDPEHDVDGSTLRARMYCTFDGSYAQFCEWMQTTFKNPDLLRVTVTVGDRPEPPKAPEIPTPPTVHPRLEEFVRSGQMTPTQATDLVGMMRLNPMQKISCIKQVREYTGLGLKEAKDLVESL